ncbi:MAG: hypothetical protein DRP63_03810, partial [Planctomycetota bacterium]
MESRRVVWLWWMMMVGVSVAAGCGEKYEAYHYSSPVIVTTSLPEGEVGVAYPDFQLAVTGAPAPYTWSDVNSTLQTYGLLLHPRTGRITGTPTQPTSSDGVTVTISVTDALNNTAQKDFTLVIHPLLFGSELQITTTSLPDGYDGQTGYLAVLTARGGTGSYTWSILSGSLPPFLNFNSSGLISGDIASIASANSLYNFTVEVTDGQQTAQANLSITVYPRLQIITTALPDGYDGQVGYSATLTAAGGTGAYTWSTVSGDLPPNLALDSSTGVISGDIASNASASSPYNFIVEVTDGHQTAQVSLSIAVCAQLRITTTSLPPAYEDETYSYTVAASAGNPSNYTWSISGQPAWLSIDSTTGELSGTPPTGSAGTYTFTVEVTDGQQ